MSCGMTQGCQGLMRRGRGCGTHVRPQVLFERVLAGAVVVVRPYDAAHIGRRRGVAAAHARVARPAVARLRPAHKELHVRGIQQAPASARSRLAMPIKHNLPWSCLVSMPL